MPLSEALRVTLEVACVLEGLGVTYFVGGSLTSSLHGIPKATQNVDLVADLQQNHIPSFASALAGHFYLDDDRIHDAVRKRGSFNVIHLATMFKLDIFVLKDNPLSREAM